jgi:MFS family permease
MLIAAVPPLVIGWPRARVRPTAMTMNLAVFGAVALGPVVGGVAAGLETWRTVFWVSAGLGVGALAMILLTYEDQPLRTPTRRSTSSRWASPATAPPPPSSAPLTSHGFGEPIVLVPLLGGVALIAALIAHQFTVSDPLMPVRKLAGTIPVAAILLAMCAAAASVGLVDLTQAALELRKVDPTHGAMLFWPEFGGAVGTAVLFGMLIYTLWVPVLALVGMAVLAAAAVVLSGVASGSEALVLVGSGCVGVGVGASVAPALFTTGFTLPPPQLPRVFALIELLRGVAAFLAAPLLLHMSETVGATPSSGIESAVLVAGRARLQDPDLDPWLESDDAAIESPDWVRSRG